MNVRSMRLIVPVVILFASAMAQAASWPALPAACTPERAAKWDNSKSEANQSACHCPPISMCPKTYEQYSNAAKSPLPMALVARCCPVIDAPQCPQGTPLAGQAVPPDGNCTPLCPAGTELAGQPTPVSGNCSPSPAECPAKYYPTLTESGIANTDVNYTGAYTYQSGARQSFVRLSNSNFGDATGTSYVSALRDRYNFSVRTGNFNGSLGAGLGEMGWTWIAGPSFCTGSNCPVQAFYQPATNGYNNGDPLLRSIISRFTASELTWFGFSFVNISYLENNLMSQAMKDAWGGADRMTIGEPAASIGTLSGFNYSFTGGYNYSPLLVDNRIEQGATGFLRQCRSAGGQYIELENKNIGGRQCAYLQCRYVYEGGTAISCLGANTKVTMADGSQKPVSELKLGDRVKGSAGENKIVAANTYQSALRVLYGINGGGALLTGDHPLHTKDGWKVVNPEAAKIYAEKPGFAKTALVVGDVLLTDKGEVVVKTIDRHSKANPITTYNIKVEGNAGFYANGIEVKGFDKMEMKYE